jgi:hypothetical protein
MATLTTTQHGNTGPNTDKTTSLLATFIDALFAVNLREELDAKTSGDKSDAAYTWGM